MCILSTGPHVCKQLLSYSLKAPGPHANAYRLLRGLQVGKPLLIEGPPGVGKTSLVTALAQASGHRLKRINLSEQTVSDLFSSDMHIYLSITENVTFVAFMKWVTWKLCPVFTIL